MTPIKQFALGEKMLQIRTYLLSYKPPNMSEITYATSDKL